MKTIFTNITGAVCLLVSIASPSFGKPFEIIAVSDPRSTTHQLKSGDLTIGITDNGGGVINQVILPGIGNIMGPEAQFYGRAGQSAIRDRSHRGWYNPTQAGHDETLGTRCEVTQTGGKLAVEPRGCALWYGDGQFDFVQNEDIGPSPYKKNPKHGIDDGLDDSDLTITINGKTIEKQAAEVYSEFDYHGTYENVMGKYGIRTPCIRHYLEFRFIRPPGHALRQFRSETKAWSAAAARSNLATHAPAGVYPGTDKDMNLLVTEWHLRHDTKLWNPTWFFARTADARWTNRAIDFKNLRGNDESGFIIADSMDEDSGHALGLYRPDTDINRNAIIGVHEKTGAIVYKDSRMIKSSPGFRIDVSPQRIPTMWKYGFNGQFEGMINRERLEPGVYETFRSEYHILYGTPRQIMDAIAAIDKI